MADRPIYLAVFLLVAACSALAYAADRPNIVIVMADDMGWRDTSYAGITHLSPQPFLPNTVRATSRSAIRRSARARQCHQSQEVSLTP